TAKGILDMPSQVISDGMVLSTDYTLTTRTSSFGSLIRGDSITVDGAAYTVREAMLMDDGKFVQLGLQKT
ncbi:MAG: head-tail joining protein, partial [Propionibacteriaceae bacterium]